MSRPGGMSVISSGDAVLTGPTSNNFDMLKAAINSGAVNSDNYGAASIASEHINQNAILSQHLSNSAFGSAHLSTGAVVNAHLNYASSDAGVRVVQIGTGTIPANGIAYCRLSETFTVNAAATLLITHLWSNALEGDQSFTGTPIMAHPVVQLPTTSLVGIANALCFSLDSVSAVVRYEFSATLASTDVYTVHNKATGAVTT